MHFKEYKSDAMKTLNKEIPKSELMINAALGLAGESGEVADIIKKALYQSHGINKDEIKKELGDILWYIAEMCEAFDFDMDEVAQCNIDKLKKRYPSGFTVSASIERQE